MKIGVDDWHFKYCENDTLLLDVFLDNGQHAMLEVNPMKNPQVPNGEIPEMIVVGSGDAELEPRHSYYRSVNCFRTAR